MSSFTKLFFYIYVSHSFFRSSVGHIVFVGSGEKMIWPNARLVVALMANFKSFYSNIRVRESKRNSMGVLFTKSTVAVGLVAFPNPTSLGLFYFIPKFFQCRTAPFGAGFSSTGSIIFKKSCLWRRADIIALWWWSMIWMMMSPLFKSVKILTSRCCTLFKLELWERLGFQPTRVFRRLYVSAI